MADNKFTAPEVLARCEAMGRLQSVLGGKWKILILWYVAFYRVQRFGELRRRLEGITQSTLTKQLLLRLYAGRPCLEMGMFAAERALLSPVSTHTNTAFAF